MSGSDNIAEGFKPSQTLENPLTTATQLMGLKQAQNQLALFPGQQQLQQQAVQGGDVDLHNKIKSAAYAAMSPILAMAPGQINHSNFAAMAGGIEKNLNLPTGSIVDDLAANPLPDGPAFDSYARALVASRSQINPAQAVANMNRTGGMVDDNGYIRPYTAGGAGYADNGAPQFTGQAIEKGEAPTFGQNGQQTNIPILHGAQVGPGIQTQYSPEFLAQKAVIGYKGNVPQYGTYGDYLNQTGHLPPGVTDPRGAAAQPVQSMTNGRQQVPGSLLNGAPPPGAPQGGGLPAGAAAPGNDIGPAGVPRGPVPGGLAPGTEASANATAGKSADAFDNYRAQGASAQNQNAIYGNMLADLHGFTPGTPKLTEVQGFLQKYAPMLAPIVGGDPEKLAQGESFNKLAAQLELANGAGSDSRLNTAAHASPNATMTPAGADLVIRQLQGGADYHQLMANQAAKYPNKADAAGFEADFREKYDPRAFMFNRMTKPQQAQYAAGLSKQDYGTISKAYKNAIDQGFIVPNANQ